MSTLIFLFWHNFVIARLDLENKTQFHMNDNNERERSNKLFNAGFVIVIIIIVVVVVVRQLLGGPDYQ